MSDSTSAKRSPIKRRPTEKPIKARGSGRGRTPADQRIHIRFDKVFPVVIGSEIFGDTAAVARNISAGGMLVETPEPLPLGAIVTVHFVHAAGDGQRIVARAEVKHHYCLNYAHGTEVVATRAMGLRFLEFDRKVDGTVENRVMH